MDVPKTLLLNTLERLDNLKQVYCDLGLYRNLR